MMDRTCDRDDRRERTPKKILHRKTEGKLPRGKLITRWMGQIREDIEMRGGKMRRNKRKQENYVKSKILVIRNDNKKTGSGE